MVKSRTAEENMVESQWSQSVRWRVRGSRLRDEESGRCGVESVDKSPWQQTQR